jgi:hypothetical protein
MQQMIQQQAHTGPKRYALVDDTGRVMGICHWDGHTKLDFPGLILVRSDSAPRRLRRCKPPSPRSSPT